VPRKLPGHSLLPLTFGQPVASWRDCIVVENNMTQSGEVDGFRPTMEGRMVRSDRYKYCVFSRGQQREFLVDMQADPGETTNLAVDPKYREILFQHRALLTRFGKEQNDPLVSELLADNVKPIAFTAENSAPKAGSAKQKRKSVPRVMASIGSYPLHPYLRPRPTYAFIRNPGRQEARSSPARCGRVVPGPPGFLPSWVP